MGFMKWNNTKYPITSMMPFGKYKDLRIYEVIDRHPSYIQWLVVKACVEFDAKTMDKYRISLDQHAQKNIQKNIQSNTKTGIYGETIGGDWTGYGTDWWW